MEQLNSSTSRQVSAAQNMQNLEKAIFTADARLKIRLDLNSRARAILGFGLVFPFCSYLVYHTLAPSGVMQNFRASNGIYGNWAQNFLGPLKSMQQVYRPEFANRDTSVSLYAYTKRIEKLRAEGQVEEGVFHPTQWH